MIKICITLDDVLRGKSEQICKIYQKHVNPSINFDELDYSSGNFQKILGFNSKSEFNKFLYEDYSFEIFAEANPMISSLDKKLSLWHLTLNDNENIDDELDLMIANPMEYNTSIPFTYFFLSKIATRVRETYFPTDSQKIWDKCDILITADTKLIENTPFGKICIKINTPYNLNINNKSGFTYNSLSEFIDDPNNLVKVISAYHGNK